MLLVPSAVARMPGTTVVLRVSGPGAAPCRRVPAAPVPIVADGSGLTVPSGIGVELSAGTSVGAPPRGGKVWAARQAGSSAASASAA